MTYLIDGRPLQSGSAVRGIGSYTRGLLSGFAELGVLSDVKLLLANGMAAPDEMRSIGVRAARSRLRVVHRALQPLLDPFFVAAAVRSERPALYHAVEFGQPIRSRTPVVVTVHDLIPFLRPSEYPWAWRYRRLVLHQLRRAQRLIAVSHATAADVHRLAGVPVDRIDVVPEGVSPAFRPADPAEIARVRERLELHRPFLLSVGTFEPRKRIRILADVVRRVRIQHDVQLVVAGDQSIFLAAVIEALAAAGVAAHTTITGHVALAELAALYGGAECLVFPSAYEGFGLPLLEAMACGTPAVAFANSSLPEVAPSGAILVRDGDTAAMSDAVGHLLADRDVRRTLAEEGRAWASGFTWRRTAERTLAVYQRVLHG